VSLQPTNANEAILFHFVDSYDKVRMFCKPFCPTPTSPLTTRAGATVRRSTALHRPPLSQRWSPVLSSQKHGHVRTCLYRSPAGVETKTGTFARSNGSVQQVSEPSRAQALL
jgi:hypothetical protein